MNAPRAILFSENEIARAVSRVARAIALARPRPDIAVPILAGAFVFAADLLRALAKDGLSLPMEFLWLRSYGAMRSGAAEIVVRCDLESDFHGKHVLLIDGVLDRGATLAKAAALLTERGAASIIAAVAVDKTLPDVSLRADFALFRGAQGFLIGYGLDDAGGERGLPYVARVD